MMANFDGQHGTLMCGTLLVNDFDRAVQMYTEALSQEVVEELVIPSTLATSWSAAAVEGARSCLLQPCGAEPEENVSYLRLIQSPDVIEPTPHATTYGWCAYEISVKDVFSLADKVQDYGFNLVGPPKKLDGIANVIPMQVVGPDEEVLYLNQVISATEHSDLPIATHDVDRFFIAVLAAADRQQVTDEYMQLLALDNVDNHDIRYGLINRAFALDLETTHSLSVLHKGRMPLLEVDQYPSLTMPRKVKAGCLPLGNALVSIAVDSLDELPLVNAITTTPTQQASRLYNNRRSLVVRGSSNELVELIEVGNTN